MNLVISNYGSFVGKKSERLVLKEKGKVVLEVPFFDLEQITIETSGVSLSSDLIYECMENGIQINFLSSNGKPYAKITAPNLTGTVITRREQILSYEDERGVVISKAIVEGKVRNQINTVKYFAKHRKSADPEVYALVYDKAQEMEKIMNKLTEIHGNRIDEVRPQLLSIEGRAAQIYWQLVQEILVENVKFTSREHKGANDPFNASLNYGYGILYAQIWGAILLAGLEPFAGFLHVDRPGKPSLVLDLIEEFRQVVVDRPIIALFRRGFDPKITSEGLEWDSRREIANKVLERLETQDIYEKKKYKIKTIIQKQSRHLAMFLRNEGNYRPFVGGW